MAKMVTISRADHDRLRVAAEDCNDLQAFDRAQTALVLGEEELIPFL